MTNNLLVTGIPRSGTTLLTAILSQNPDYVVFSEPNWLKQVRHETDSCLAFCTTFKQHTIKIRDDIKQGRPIQIKQSKVGSGLPSNYYLRDPHGEIITDKDEALLTLPKDASNAPFIIKANAQFTACLDALSDDPDFKVCCVIRNPIAAIMSWRSLKIPVSFGNMKIAEKYAQDFVEYTAPAQSLMEKQVLIADWFFKQYQACKDKTILIKYENLIQNTQQELAKIVDINAHPEFQPLTSQNKNKHYNLEEYQSIKQCLNKHGQYFQAHYPELVEA